MSECRPSDDVDRVLPERLTFRFFKDNPHLLEVLKRDPRLPKNKIDKVKMPPKWVPHPNKITLTGLGLTVTGAVTSVLEREDGAAYGLSLVVAGLVCDALDGFVARKYVLFQTKPGAKLDPLVDKLNNITLQGIVAGYALAEVSPALSAVLLGVIGLANWNDLESTRQRYDGDTLCEQAVNCGKETFEGFLKTKDVELDLGKDGEATRANWFGKSKTFLNCFGSLAFLALMSFEKKEADKNADMLVGSLSSTYGIAAASGFMGVRQRKKIAASSS